MSGLVRRNKQSLAPLDELIPLKEAAEMLCLDESTIRKGRAGTANLTRVRQGAGKRRRVFLLRSELELHIRLLITDAKEQQGRPLELVYGT
ncbi:MAG TPA: hypothetical protein VF735_09010 [Pyrinomonadaceae bacterium]|jgi:hypothetical protein